MRHTRTLVLLAALTIGLALLVLFEPGHKADTASGSLTALDASTLEGLRVERSGQATVELERRGSHWWMTAPWAQPLPALDYRIESALGLLSAPSEHRQPIAGLDLAQFELDAPVLVLEAGGLRLSFGNTHPITRERHVLLGDELHRIADFHFAAIDVDPADWVATAALPPDVHLERIELPGRVLLLAPPAPAPDGSTDPAAAELAWSGPQGDGELPAGEVANAWREARAWRVEPSRHWDIDEASTHSRPGPEATSPASETALSEAEAAATTTAAPAFTTPALGALDAATATPITGAAGATTAPITGAMPQGTHVRLGWDGGGAVYRIVKREPELVLARDDVALAWVFEGPDARLLLGLVDDATSATAAAGADTLPAATAPTAADALPGFPGEHPHAH
jgi:hypothetical protein